MRESRREFSESLLSLIVFLVCGAIIYGTAGIIATVASAELKPALLQSEHFVVICKAISVWALMGSVVGLFTGIYFARVINPEMSLSLAFVNIFFVFGVGISLFGSVGIALFLYPLLQINNIFVLRSSLMRAVLCGMIGVISTRATIEIAEWINLKILEKQIRQMEEKVEKFFSIKNGK